MHQITVRTVVSLCLLAGLFLLTAATAGDRIFRDAFSELPEYVVVAIVGENGSVSPDEDQLVREGSVVEYQLSPDTGYRPIEPTGTCGGVVVESTYTTLPIVADCSVVFEFELIPTHTVTATAGEGGGIDPAERTVEHGSTTTFTVSPDEGYSIDTVTGCNGGLDGQTYTTGQITEDCTVTATFSVNSYTVTLAADPVAGGSVIGAGDFDFGTEVFVTAVPAEGYTFVNWTEGETEASAVAAYTFTMPAADRSLTANFSLNTYTVTGSADTGGSIDPAEQTVSHGSTTTFTVSPDEGYSIDTVTGCGGSLVGQTYTTGQITEDCTVTATFSVNSYTVTSSVALGQGTITPSTQTVSHGSAASFTITPADGWVVDSVNGDSCLVTDVGQGGWTASNIQADCEVTATFGIVFQDCPDCPTMVMIPAGSFTQGSPESELQSFARERPQRTVNVPAFAMGQTEVTFAEWDACVADGGCTHNPGDQGFGRGSRPVIDVNWNDAQEYVAWLSTKTGQQYRLPSESEREYATRAGTTGRFNTGDCITTDQANFNGESPATGCPTGIYRAQTLPVASFAPNAFGLYDTHGNVWEWVQDCWNDDYNGAPTDGSAWMSGDCSRAVLRGGSWYSFGSGLRSALRIGGPRGSRGTNAGFRVARSVTL